MKQILLRHGLAGAAILIGINVLILLITGIPGPDDYALGEVIGYATIIVALVPIFFGIRYYRDEVLDGTVSFAHATAAGLAIAVVPSIAFAAYNLLYVEVIDPRFAEKYMEYTLASAREEMSAAEFEAYASEIEAQSAMLTDPVVQMVVMFLTVFLIGVVVALISAVILRRR